MGFFDFLSSSNKYGKKVLFGFVHAMLAGADGDMGSEEVAKSLELLGISPNDEEFLNLVQNKSAANIKEELRALNQDDRKKLVKDLIEISKSDGHFSPAESTIILAIVNEWGWDLEKSYELLISCGLSREECEQALDSSNKDKSLPKDDNESSDNVFCAKCGSKQNENKFCTNCGNKIG
jgi:hypothetical protein